jgi:hypothetical protein
MRINIFVSSLVAMLLAGCAADGVIVEKRSRQIPDSSIPGTEGIHSFVFRGPTGTSRLPITVPGEEFWPAEPNAVCKFILRDRAGNVRSQLVTPEVFARYQTGDYFNDLQSPPPARGKHETSNGSSVETIRVTTVHRRGKGYVRHKTHSRRSHRAVAKRKSHPKDITNWSTATTPYSIPSISRRSTEFTSSRMRVIKSPVARLSNQRSGNIPNCE